MPRQTSSVDIDQMIADLPRDEQIVVKNLRSLVLECIPESIERAYHDVAMPYYTGNRLICYIMPPSESLEPSNASQKQKTRGVALGFNQGNLMSNDLGLLHAEGRKQVRMMYFKTLADINANQVRALLFEAAMVDQQFAKKRKQ